MSTTARKARKRLRHDDLSLRDALVRRGLPADSVYVHPPFQHPVKTGTPVELRAKNVHRDDAKLARVSPGIVARIASMAAGFASRWAR
jgi:hypothetical protein